MGKKRRKSWFWRFIGSVLKEAAKVASKSVSYVLEGIKNKSEYKKEKINQLGDSEKGHLYNIQPNIVNFEVEKKIAGNYSLTNKRLLEDSMIVLLFGKRGSGKSALGFRILENTYATTRRKCFVLGVKSSLLPRWIVSIDDMEKVPNGSVILVDEGAISYGSRESMSISNRELSKFLAIARHKNHTLIFITQNTGLIDKNILKLADILMIKEGSLLQLEMERAEIRKFFKKAKQAFAALSKDKKKYAYIIDSDFEGVVSFSLPNFWSESLSKNRAV